MTSGTMPLPSEIVLLPIPFTDLSASKRRPVLVLKAGNARGDFLAAQITSQTQYRPAISPVIRPVAHREFLQRW